MKTGSRVLIGRNAAIAAAILLAACAGQREAKQERAEADNTARADRRADQTLAEPVQPPIAPPTPTVAEQESRDRMFKHTEASAQVAANQAAGTAHQASLEKVSVAGKTGTAQWGPKERERTAAWFAGFVPAEHPQYAFAALYEGDVGSKVHGGSAAAPMIGRILRQIYGERGDGNEKPAESEEDTSD